MEETYDPFDETPERQPTGHSPGRGSFDVMECLKTGWHATINNFGSVLGVMVVGTILILLSYLTIIGIFLLVPVIIWGGVRFMLNILDGKGEFNDLFSGFKNYGQVVGQSLMLMILMIALGIVGSSVSYAGIFMNDLEVQFIGTLVSLIWTLVVMIRLYWAVFFLVDRQMSALDSLKASWNATRGNWLMLVFLGIMSFLISILGTLALLVGLFIAVPVVYFMYAAAYRQTAGHPEAGEEPVDIWE